MRSIIILLAMFALFSGGANAQEGPKATDPKPVILKAESYEELYKIEDQIKQAARDEQEAFNVYKGREATRLALQQAFESARLRALMALGITDPKTPIAPPPEEKPEKPKP
jgi:hypothetical protein